MQVADLDRRIVDLYDSIDFVRAPNPIVLGQQSANSQSADRLSQHGHPILTDEGAHRLYRFLNSMDLS